MWSSMMGWKPGMELAALNGYTPADINGMLWRSGREAFCGDKAHARCCAVLASEPATSAIALKKSGN